MNNKTRFKSQPFTAEAENISGVLDKGRKPCQGLIGSRPHVYRIALFSSCGTRSALFARKNLQIHAT